MVNGLVGDDAGGGGACGLGDREPVSLVRLPQLTANSPTPPQARTGVLRNSLSAPPGAMEEQEIVPDAVLTVNRNWPAGSSRPSTAPSGGRRTGSLSLGTAGRPESR